MHFTFTDGLLLFMLAGGLAWALWDCGKRKK
jgi:hypothetical protein